MIIPFVTYEYQDRGFEQLFQWLGIKDVLVEKSRDLGATWMLDTVAFTQWMFSSARRPIEIGMLSRNEDLVDTYDDSGTLFWKLDHLYKMLPRWMRPKRTRKLHNMTNLRNGATIKGDATTANAFRGDRLTWAFLDEYAFFAAGDDSDVLKATQHCTQSRAFVSTPNGDNNSYAQIALDDSRDFIKIVFDWKDHPTRRQGLYTTVDNEPYGELLILDKDYQFDANYEFILDGKVRSPYYDFECSRPGATKQTIAQELDRDYYGSAAVVFDSLMLARYEKQHCRPPVHMGELTFDPEDGPDVEFSHSKHGKLWLWFNLGANGLPPASHRYAVCCDIASGSGAEEGSNSVATVISATTLEVVAMFVSKTIKPADFADYAIALCYWFSTRTETLSGVESRPAKLNWETNGSCGSTFTHQVIQARAFENTYYRLKEHVNTKGKKTKAPGWGSTPDKKDSLIGLLEKAMSSGKLICPSKFFVKECRQFVFKNGHINHSREIQTTDEGSKSGAHGDSVISVALCNLTVPELLVDRPNRRKKPSVDERTMKYRLDKYDAEQRAINAGSGSEW